MAARFVLILEVIHQYKEIENTKCNNPSIWVIVAFTSDLCLTTKMRFGSASAQLPDLQMQTPEGLFIEEKWLQQLLMDLKFKTSKTANFLLENYSRAQRWSPSVYTVIAVCSKHIFPPFGHTAITVHQGKGGRRSPFLWGGRNLQFCCSFFALKLTFGSFLLHYW